MSDPTGHVLIEVRAERDRQKNRLGYDAKHDDEHGPAGLLFHAARYLHLSKSAHGTSYDRDRMVQAAALMVATIEAYDRAEERRRQEPAMVRGSTPAETCLLNGWTVGTVLRGSDIGYGEVVIKITAIGERNVLAKAVTRGDQVLDEPEVSWMFDHREWGRA